MGPGFHSGWVLGLALALSPSEVQATPFIPTDDAQVLEILRATPGDLRTRELRQLRSELSRRPGDLDLAVRLASRYYRIALAEGDPRYIGYAQAALLPWWHQSELPLEVLVLRAGLLQFRHEFGPALADLDQAIKRDPRHAQAWALRAAIHTVLARYPEAKRDCQALKGLASDLIALACSLAVDASTGKAGPSYDALSRALDQDFPASSDQKLWVLTRLAEIAQRLGWAEAADQRFRQALQLNIEDAYLLAAYADFLLDQGRAKEVVSLLSDKVRNDVLLVRLALAEKAMGHPAAREHEATIQARIEAARLRQDRLHLGDEARFALYFLNRPDEALKLAQANWDSGQHEARDARILLDAAIAARSPAGAKAALEWLEVNRHEDVYLNRLASRLRELNP